MEGLRQSAGLGTREESWDELLLWEEKRMMGGLCQYAWEGKKMGMKEKCVCSTGRGFWDEQNCWLCKLCIWFLMNLSLPAHWLLSCYCWQETSSINTHTLAHIHKNFICSAKISCIRRHAQNFILWRSEGSLQTQGRNFFYSGWSLILIGSFFV